MGTAIHFGDGNLGIQVGNSSGTINFHAAARPETPPAPLSTVPFRRDPDFVNPDGLLDLIDQKTSAGARIAFVGLGGVGKSQLAIEYSYLVRDRSPETWVLWIHASNVTRFEQSCQDIAEQAKIPGRKDPNANIYKILSDWLNNPRTKHWVLIFDNLDQEEFLFTTPTSQPDHSSRSIWSYFSRSTRGCLIVTTRYRAAVSKIVEDDDIIPVEPMSESHAVQLFEKKLGTRPSARAEVLDLVSALDCMPLALVQAAVYIKKRSPRTSVKQYLEAFEASDEDKIRLLGFEGGQQRRDEESRSSILITCQISFDYIQERRPSATDLLSVMSFFDRQGIAENLIRYDSLKDDPDSSGSDRTFHNFEEDIELLRDYSMISVNADGMGFEMHRLIQLAIQNWLKTQPELELWTARFICCLEEAYPCPPDDNWAECQALAPHVQRAVLYTPKTTYGLELWAALLFYAAVFSLDRGNFVAAEMMAEKSANARTELHGPDSQETLSSLRTLASVYHARGDWDMAESLQIQLMDSSRRVLGPEHHDTTRHLTNLAITYGSLGKLEQAEKLQVQILDTYLKSFGPEHSRTLGAMVNLSITYRKQGKVKEAEKLQLRVIHTRKRIKGTEHIETLGTLNLLCHTYRYQGRLQKAERSQMQAVRSLTETVGLDHPATLHGMKTLSSIYLDQGRFEEAERLRFQHMDICKRTLGPDHPYVLRDMKAIAQNLYSSGRVQDALQMMIECVQLSSKTLGTEHRKTINLISIMGNWQRNEDGSSSPESVETPFNAQSDENIEDYP
ncbi:P-loop containing nucleoside triphosphate hydrolase protein [Penicillium angulare]|uniref:P-loop containing nucleoside triphosphate hydrolase protein n=1 Tax=Penicillium angulare TaxID=116970 RepID=A0A9W9GEG0_9EURO|nr:P-loop containing nucleoside triphosphate hydrolase protein [Penicillium angulare]